MATPLNKVRAGDPLVIPAATFNTFIDAAREHRARQHTTRVPPSHAARDRAVILVRNETGALGPRYGVVGLDGPIINRADNAVQFFERIALRGALPSAAHRGRFAILLEPLAPLAIGRACIAGITLAQVWMASESDPFADLELGDVTRLRSGALGGAQLLWIEPPEARDTPNIAWALVRLGGGGAPLVAPVICQLAGGGPGGVTPEGGNSHCTWTYDFWLSTTPVEERTEANKLGRNPDGSPGDAQQPAQVRLPYVEYEHHPLIPEDEWFRGLAGLFLTTVDGVAFAQWTLLQVFDERPVMQGCDCPV